MKEKGDHFKQRKFRAVKGGKSATFREECDNCGKKIPKQEWYFERVEGHYGIKNPFGSGRTQHIEKSEILCSDCVDPKKVVKSHQKYLERG